MPISRRAVDVDDIGIHLLVLQRPVLRAYETVDHLLRPLRMLLDVDRQRRAVHVIPRHDLHRVLLREAHEDRHRDEEVDEIERAGEETLGDLRPTPHHHGPIDLQTFGGKQVLRVADQQRRRVRDRQIADLQPRLNAARYLRRSGGDRRLLAGAGQRQTGRAGEPCQSRQANEFPPAQSMERMFIVRFTPHSSPLSSSNEMASRLSDRNSLVIIELMRKNSVLVESRG